MVADDLSRARGRVVDRFAVARIDDPRRELDRSLQRAQVVTERVRAAFRVEADGRSDAREQVIAADQLTVPKKTEMSVSVTRQFDDTPAVELAPLVQKLGIAGEADERRERVPLLDQLGGDRLRDAVRSEPRCDSVRPVV